MKCFRMLTAAFALLAAIFVYAPCRAQTSAGTSHESYQAAQVPSNSSGAFYKTRPVPATEIVAPFSLDASPAASANPVEFRSESQMSEMDRNLAASAEPSIHEGATMAGIDFNTGNGATKSLFARLCRVTFFCCSMRIMAQAIEAFSRPRFRAAAWAVSASFPIQRRGYSLFSPAPVNALAIAAFNRIRADESASNTADWFATAWCDAALTGSHPAVFSVAVEICGREPRLVIPPHD